MLRFPATPQRPPAPHLRLVAPAESTAPLLHARAIALVAAAGVALGAAVRIMFVAAADFPLGDGGMFYAMAADLQANAFAVSAFTSYNLDAIPSAYPPLGFYATAALAHLSPLSLLDAFRLVPLAASLATMLAFALLARRLLGQNEAFAAAVFAFALNPRSFKWMIMGGGATRSPGLLFATLALHEALRLLDGRRQAAVTLGLLAALTVLCHLEMAWFLSFSIALLVLLHNRRRAAVPGLAAAGALAIAASSPWWVPVIALHGTGPFVAAATTGSPAPTNPLLAFLVFRPTDEPMFALIAALALVGVVTRIADRRWFLPLWLLASGLLDPRGFGNVASLPIAMLAGIAAGQLILPMLVRDGHGWRRWALASAVFAFVAFYATVNALIATPRLLAAVTPPERLAMTWVSATTPTDATFLVVSNETWAVDRTSEWFPVIAGRHSVATVQGYEWIPGAFSERLAAYRAAQRCADRDAACIASWRQQHGDFDYLYMPKVANLQRGLIIDPYECCAALRQSLRADDAYATVYDGPGATIFRHIH